MVYYHPLTCLPIDMSSVVLPGSHSWLSDVAGKWITFIKEVVPSGDLSQMPVKEEMAFFKFKYCNNKDDLLSFQTVPFWATVWAM